jgi:hypothetical protein
MRPSVTREPVAFESFIAKWSIRILLPLVIFGLYQYTSRMKSLEQDCSAQCKEKGFPCHYLSAPDKYAREAPHCYCLTEEEEKKNSPLDKDRQIF